MNKFLKLLPALALVLGVTFAFANAPKVSPFAQTKRANVNGAWVDITGKKLGIDYSCPANSIVCTETYDNGVLSSTQFGTYTPVPMP